MDSNSNTFKLKFFVDEELNVGLKMLWVEQKQEVALPEHLWPDDPVEVKSVAKLAFPLYAMMLEAIEAREVTRKFELQQALLKAGLIIREVQVPSSDGNELYTLKFYPSYISCTCQDWVWNQRASKGRCKHIRRYLETRQGLETMRYVNPPARMWPNWTLRQIEYAHEHAEYLGRIVRHRRVNDAFVGG
jgi:hypothetical protein